MALLRSNVSLVALLSLCLYSSSASALQSCNSVVIGHASSRNKTFTLLAWDPNNKQVITKTVSTRLLSHPDPLWIWSIRSTLEHGTYTISQPVAYVPISTPKNDLVTNSDASSTEPPSTHIDSSVTDTAQTVPSMDPMEEQKNDPNSSHESENSIYLAYNAETESIHFKIDKTTMAQEDIAENTQWHMVPVNHSLFILNPHSTNKEVLSMDDQHPALIHSPSSLPKYTRFFSLYPNPSMNYLLTIKSATTGKQCYINLSHPGEKIGAVTAIFESFRPHFL